MAIKDIDKMTAPLSRRGETQLAMSDETDRIENAAMTWFLDKYGQEGIDYVMEGGTSIDAIINEYLQFRLYEMN